MEFPKICYKIGILVRRKEKMAEAEDEGKKRKMTIKHVAVLADI